MNSLRRASSVTGLSIALLCALLSSGCMTTETASKLAQQTAAPGWEMAEASDLTFCVAAFQRKHDRWPSDYSELSSFIQHSDGYLALMRNYDRVEFAKSGTDGLDISYTVGGVAHHITFAPTQVASSK
jgi:hypothetical protein